MQQDRDKGGGLEDVDPPDRRLKPAQSENQQQQLPQKCPRCDSINTKFCYYNNYSLSQPRYFCKTCRRYWTQGGTLRNVPVGGGCRKTKRKPSASGDNSRSQLPTQQQQQNLAAPPPNIISTNSGVAVGPALRIAEPANLSPAPAPASAPTLSSVNPYYPAGAFLSSLPCKMHKFIDKTDEFSSSSVIKAVSSWAAVEQGRHLHAHVMKSGLDCTIYVGSAVIDMYSKCGMVEDAQKVFSVMPEKNVVSWNSMITGYAQNGFCKEALLLFQEMTSSGILPTAVTFVGILFACSHAGLVEEGRNFYNLMVHNYGIPPSMEHCTCMVDLLGRAGYLEEAEAFLLSSSFSKEPGIWGSLLSTCGVHKNSDVGSRAAQHCLFLEPHYSSSYTALSNIYASKELWSEVSRIRDLMKDMGVEKEPGCSWIESLRFGLQ